MKRGLDVVVGTTGRVKDHINKGNLLLGSVEHVILDEADEMLNMGFQEDVEFILEAVKEARGTQDVQTLLFSATVPAWGEYSVSRPSSAPLLTQSCVSG